MTFKYFFLICKCIYTKSLLEITKFNSELFFYYMEIKKLSLKNLFKLIVKIYFNSVIAFSLFKKKIYKLVIKTKNKIPI